ncbi:MAG: hypothetical protein JSW34_07050, partial [Candidatus Zixiibacteriota bacterium]
MRVAAGRQIAVVAIALVASLSPDSRAGRLFGNASISYEHVTRDAEETATDDVTRETAIINYEDVLFYKNRIRLTANLSRRQLSFSDYHEFQPIYHFDLSSYGYSLNLRYSPYKRRSLTFTGTEPIDVYYRDWRVTSQLNYPRYPTLSFVYSRLKNFDREDERRFDAFNRNLAVQSSYNVNPVSLRLNYSNLRQVNNLPGGSRATTETYSGTVGFSRNNNRLGYFNATYNYYDTRRQARAALSQKSYTHSVNSLVVFTPLSRLTFNAGYSGRFQQAEQQTQRLENDNQNISAQAEFSPTTYLSLHAGKGYQQSNVSTGNDNITEYINLGATATRYIRSGVDTRLTFTRTIFQQSMRLVAVTDTTGAVIATFNDGDYILDSYQASLGFFPRKYIKAYLDITATHDSDPVDPRRRYQLTRSLDIRADFTRRLEGRFRLTSQYTGDRLRLDRSFSENYNVGVSYNPRNNLNMNLTYIYSDFSGTTATSFSSVTGYIS